MPHMIIKMFPGRNDEIKAALAKKMQDAMVEELHVDRSVVTVSIEDIPQDNWPEEMKKIPKDTFFIG